MSARCWREHRTWRRRRQERELERRRRREYAQLVAAGKRRLWVLKSNLSVLGVSDSDYAVVEGLLARLDNSGRIVIVLQSREILDTRALVDLLRPLYARLYPILTIIPALPLPLIAVPGLLLLLLLRAPILVLPRRVAASLVPTAQPAGGTLLAAFSELYIGVRLGDALQRVLLRLQS